MGVRVRQQRLGAVRAARGQADVPGGVPAEVPGGHARVAVVGRQQGRRPPLRQDARSGRGRGAEIS